MDAATFLIQVLNGVQYGMLLFLVASGLTLIFGIMGIINLAHGSFYMVGAYLAFSLAGLLGNFWLALATGIVAALALGAALEWLVMKHLYENGVWAIFSTLDPRVLQFKPGILLGPDLVEEILDRAAVAIGQARGDA